MSVGGIDFSLVKNPKNPGFLSSSTNSIIYPLCGKKIWSHENVKRWSLNQNGSKKTYNIGKLEKPNCELTFLWLPTLMRYVQY